MGIRGTLSSKRIAVMLNLPAPRAVRVPPSERTPVEEYPEPKGGTAGQTETELTARNSRY